METESWIMSDGVQTKKISVGPTNFGWWVMKTKSYHSKLTHPNNTLVFNLVIKIVAVLCSWERERESLVMDLTMHWWRGPRSLLIYGLATEWPVLSDENSWIVFSFLVFITQFFEWLDDQNRVTRYGWWYPNKNFSMGPTNFGWWVMKTQSYHSKLSNPNNP